MHACMCAAYACLHVWFGLASHLIQKPEINETHQSGLPVSVNESIGFKDGGLASMSLCVCARGSETQNKQFGSRHWALLPSSKF